jgi:predicted TIM-barrel fold metal-dependent hydrolase
MNRVDMKILLERGVVTIDSHTHVGISVKFYHQYGYPYALSLEDLIIRMELLGIDCAVVFPFVDSAFYQNDSQSSQVKTTTRQCHFPYEIENRNLLNEIHKIFPEHSRKFLPFLMFDPSRETEKQAAHLEELSQKHPVFGLKTATTYIQAFVHDLESKGKPILEFAEKNQMPIVFHSAVHPDDPWASVYDIVDFAERHPDIRVCIAHSARFVKPALEKADHLDNCFVDLSAFIIHCRLALQNSSAVAKEDLRFPADYSDPLKGMTRLAETYPGTILWGSDTPFYYWIQRYFTSTGELVQDNLQCGYKEEVQLLNNLQIEIKTRIAYKNSMRFIFGG